MLTRLKLGNFKSWRELDIELAPITLLFGTNSSGKTSILQSLLLLKQNFERGSQTEPLYLGTPDSSDIHFGSYSDLIFEHDVNRPFAINIRWRGDFQLIEPSGLQGALENYTQAPTQREVEQLERQSPKFDVMERKQTWRTVSESITSGVEFSAIQNGAVIRKMLQPQVNSDTLQSSQFPEIIAAVSDTLVFTISFRTPYATMLKNLVHLGPLRLAPQRTYQWSGVIPQKIEGDGKHTIDVLIASTRSATTTDNGQLLTTVEHWMKALGLVAELTVKSLDKDKRFYETVVRVPSGLSQTSLKDTGFGISQVLPVITMLFFVPEGSILLIEQPELHLHPSAQSALADLFLEVAEKRHLQLIIESHSEHLLTRFQRRIAETSSPFANPENVKAYFCKPGANGSEIEQVKVDRFGQIQNYPDNFFGDLTGDIEAMFDAGTQRRLEELKEGE